MLLHNFHFIKNSLVIVMEVVNVGEESFMFHAAFLRL